LASQYSFEYSAGAYGEVKPIPTRAELDIPPDHPVDVPTRKRKLAAILHADVVGFSRLMGEDETGTHQALGRLRHAVDPIIAAHGGRIVGTAGDSLLADFPSVVDALNCALEMQRAAHSVNDAIPPNRRLQLRIGVNLGDVIVDTDDIFGDGVNIAARLASRTPSTSRSKTSSILITAFSETNASKILPNPFVLIPWGKLAASRCGAEGAGPSSRQQLRPEPWQRVLLPGRFTYTEDLC
jgi:class 3 adenylate cyclase